MSNTKGKLYLIPTRLGDNAPLEVLPIYIREGAIIPLGPVKQYVDEFRKLHENTYEVSFNVIEGVIEEELGKSVKAL